jgi:hypothetical protein
LEDVPVRDYLDDVSEPSAADLAAIEAEEPLNTAEQAWLDAEISLLGAADRGEVSDLDRRRVRRAEQAVIRETLVYVARLTRSPGPRLAA